MTVFRRKFVNRVGLKYPKLPVELREMLELVPPSHPAPGLVYFPCKASLKSGETLNCVYLCEATAWHKYWGIWPEEDRGKLSVPVEAISSLEGSPVRLPPRYADVLYEAGESGMGYHIFTVQFNEGTRLTCVTGNAVDFIGYPRGLGPEHVTGVIPHEGRDDRHLRRGPDYYWCLFSASACSHPLPR